MPAFLLRDQLAQSCHQAELDCGRKGGHMSNCEPSGGGVPGFWYDCYRSEAEDDNTDPEYVEDPGWLYDQNEYGEPVPWPSPSGGGGATTKPRANGATPSQLPLIAGGLAVAAAAYYFFLR